MNVIFLLITGKLGSFNVIGKSGIPHTRSIAQGFSLIELLIVIVILGILTSAAVPLMKPLLENLELRTSANAIKHQLYMARTRALGDPIVHCGVKFDTLKHTIQTFLDDGVPVGNDQFDPGSDHIFMLAYTLPKKITMQIGGTGHNNVIVFRADGSAKVRGLTLTIANSSKKTKTISVLSSTGRIKVF